MRAGALIAAAALCLLAGCDGGAADAPVDPNRPVRAPKGPGGSTAPAVAPTPPPTAPALTAEGASDTSIALRWTAAQDFSGRGISGYRLLLAGVPFRTVADTEYVDLQLAMNEQYCYQVQAIDGSGAESEKSAQACARTYQTGEAPVVTFKTLANDSSVPAPGQQVVELDATVKTGTITRVELYAGRTLVGSDDSAPFSIPWKDVPGGLYALTARAYASTGAKTYSLPITVRVGNAAGPATVSFSLINADTGEPLPGFDPIARGERVRLATLPTRRISVRANTLPAVVGSVRFTFDGSESYRVEGAAPYLLFGRDELGFFAPGVLHKGPVHIEATPYTQGAATGTQGSGGAIDFTVMDG